MNNNIVLIETLGVLYIIVLQVGLASGNFLGAPISGRYFIKVTSFF